jgi:hypothetical protein
LQIARGNFGAFGQFILRQSLAHALAAHVCAELLDSLPFFLGNCHDILHRFQAMNMNDTYIVKKRRVLLASTGQKRCNRQVSNPKSKIIGWNDINETENLTESHGFVARHRAGKN